MCVCVCVCDTRVWSYDALFAGYWLVCSSKHTRDWGGVLRLTGSLSKTLYMSSVDAHPSSSSASEPGSGAPLSPATRDLIASLDRPDFVPFSNGAFANFMRDTETRIQHCAWLLVACIPFLFRVCVLCFVLVIMCVCVHVGVCVCVCMHACMYAVMCVVMYGCMYMYMYAC